MKAVGYVVLGTLIGGAAGVFAGVSYSLIFYPQSGNGPLIMFLTGPIGALVGLIAGCIAAAMKR